MRGILSTGLTLASCLAFAGAAQAQIDGTGTAGRIAKFLDSDTIENSVIRESGGNVAISATPVNALRFLVNGGMGTTRTSNSLAAFIANQSGTANIAEFWGNGVFLSGFDSAGNMMFSTANKANATIGFPVVNLGGRDLTIQAGGNASDHGDAALGGNLILRAGNANISGDLGCPSSGPFGNSVRIIAGDNVFGAICSTVNNGDIEFYAGDGQPERMRLVGNSGFLGIGTGAPTNPLEMASGAHVTAGGVWTNASSRELKENIRELESADALGALMALKPTRYTYKADKGEECVGFIAEDVPDLVATGDRKSLSPMDVVGVLTKVVQEQQIQIAELKKQVEALKK